jgi:hypothetical protein
MFGTGLLLQLQQFDSRAPDNISQIDLVENKKRQVAMNLPLFSL